MNDTVDNNANGSNDNDGDDNGDGTSAKEAVRTAMDVAAAGLPLWTPRAPQLPPPRAPARRFLSLAGPEEGFFHRHQHSTLSADSV